MLRTNINKLLRRLCVLLVLLTGVFVFWGGPEGYAVPEECSTCDYNYWNCTSPCEQMTDPNDWEERRDCYAACRNAHSYCSPGCTPSGMPYRPPCPGASGCAAYGQNCETACSAEKDVCVAQCEPGEGYNSCWNLCQDGINHCRAFCQAEYYDCLWCED